jgi:hypothetical protein
MWIKNNALENSACEHSSNLIYSNKRCSQSKRMNEALVIGKIFCKTELCLPGYTPTEKP